MRSAEIWLQWQMIIWLAVNPDYKNNKANDNHSYLNCKCGVDLSFKRLMELSLAEIGGAQARFMIS